ncbi:NADH-quinone oxidoreductase subunit A [Pseudochryseolinea flava]|uniref:NADH-quinone oxidoreductase subunit A n=1 Tax=Pseudochryseolinea flava TaxID=2059302 RepID=A0A364XXU9_9BACT|nr:NADH-quinone oxidoreductase subunit A [Pseudochryseolinea flava]RAV98393.1 NADH-quinone oxidoreductase subunit A [Pseudochryseolinea flava]
MKQSLSAFGEVLLFIAGGTIFILVTFLVSRLIRPARPNPEKLSTYESGEEPTSEAWSQFNTRFYIVALIFLLFEVEIVFLFPWTTIFAKSDLIKATDGQWGWFTLLEMIIFIVILALGLVYAWVNGHLDWIKPDPKPTQIDSPVPHALYEKLNEKFKNYRKEGERL